MMCFPSLFYASAQLCGDRSAPGVANVPDGHPAGSRTWSKTLVKSSISSWNLWVAGAFSLSGHDAVRTRVGVQPVAGR